RAPRRRPGSSPVPLSRHDACSPSVGKRGRLWGAPREVKRPPRFCFSRGPVVPAPGRMRLAHLLLAGALVGAFAACSTSISTINGRPEKYYQKKVSFSGQITRTQALTGETLLEVADGHGSRTPAHTTEPVEQASGDWVKVDGMLVPEVRVGDQVLYDVVAADRIRRARAPRFRNLM